MTGFSISVERVSDEESEDPPQIWESSIELTRHIQTDDSDLDEAWKAATDASAYRDCIGSSPANALREFSKEVREVFGDTGTAEGVLWVASADARGYGHCVGQTMDAALRTLSKEFHCVYGDRNEGDQ